MEKRKIKPVSNTKEKYETYKKLIGRYRAALRYEFYLEGLLVDYALLEDRLRSYIYHMGLLANRNTDKLYKKTKGEILAIVSEYMKRDENYNLSIKNITGKMEIVKAVLKWSSETEEDYSDKPYLRVLKSAFEGLDIGMLLEVFDDIDDWRKYRNEVVHGLMNKNLASLNDDISQRVIDGKRYSEILDSQLRILKKGNTIRRSLRLQNN